MPEKDEAAFRRWYDAWASRYGMNPDPDDPRQHYDYRAAFQQGIPPPNVAAGEHWPSLDKDEGHPNIIVGGFHTKTGQRVPGYTRARSVAELVELGWDPETAQQLNAQPEPAPDTLMYLTDVLRRMKALAQPGGR